MMPDVHVKLNQGLQWRKQNSTKGFFLQQFILRFKEETIECYGRSIALHADETWTLRKVGQKYLLSS